MLPFAMLEEGLQLMAVGMTTVFAMLTLLVGLLHASAAIFSRLPEEAAPENLEADPDEELMLLAVAIAAAHRERSA